MSNANNGEPTVRGMTRNDWIRYYLSLSEPQRQKLDRIVRCFTVQNEKVKR